MGKDAMNRDGFLDFILDQLNGIGSLEARRMFGGVGLYSDGVFFGIIDRGRLYFKTGSKTRSTYVEMGMKPFRPNAKQTLRTYYEVPVDIIEDQDLLVTWAGGAIRSQSSKKPFNRRRG